MPLYFLMGTTTDRGQRLLMENSDLMVDAVRECDSEGAEVLGQYAVLGRYDFVMLAEADDNDAVARLSLAIGVRVGLHIETLPAIALRVQSEDSGDTEGAGLAYADTPSADAPSGEWDLPDQQPD